MGIWLLGSAALETVEIEPWFKETDILGIDGNAGLGTGFTDTAACDEDTDAIEFLEITLLEVAVDVIEWVWEATGFWAGSWELAPTLPDNLAFTNCKIQIIRQIIKKDLYFYYA